MLEACEERVISPPLQASAPAAGISTFLTMHSLLPKENTIRESHVALAVHVMNVIPKHHQRSLLRGWPEDITMAKGIAYYTWRGLYKLYKSGREQTIVDLLENKRTATAVLDFAKIWLRLALIFYVEYFVKVSW